MNYFYWFLIILFLIGIALITLGSIYINKSNGNNDNNKINKFSNFVNALQEKYKIGTNKILNVTHENDGIVIVAGGPIYGPLALRLVNKLEELNSMLPIEIWTLDKQEADDISMKTLANKLNVVIKNLEPFYDKNKIPKLKRELGYIGKSLALYNSKFNNVLLLDADNLVLEAPDSLFTLLDEHHAVLWPDVVKFDSVEHYFDKNEKYKNSNYAGITGPNYIKYENIFKGIGLNNTDNRIQYESGQLLFNRTACLEALKFITELNLNFDITYNVLLGDKDTYAIGLELFKIPFLSVPYRPAFVGYLNENQMAIKNFRGKAFVQRHPLSGKPFFVHFAGDSTHFKNDKLSDLNYIMYPSENAEPHNYTAYRRWSDGKLEKFII